MNETETQDVEVMSASDGHALEALERAAVDIQIATAKKYPRAALSKIRAEMLSIATMDEETAASCCYALPRGGKMIKGPSVRLAEIAITCFGNLRVGTRTIATEIKGDSPHVVVQGVAHDLEKNNYIAMEKRRRITKKKSKTAPDEDDVNLATNSCASIALRDVVFKVIPKILVNSVYESARKVAVGEVKSLVARRGKVVDRLKQMGVTEDRILARIDARKMDDIDLDKLEILIGLGTSLKDGETTIEEAFPAIDGSQLVKTETEDNSNPDLQPSPGAALATAPPAPKSLPTPQEDLAALITGAGYEFILFQRWCLETGNVPKADSLSSFDEVPSAEATRFLRSRKGLLEQLKMLKEGVK